MFSKDEVVGGLKQSDKNKIVSIANIKALIDRSS